MIEDLIHWVDTRMKSRVYLIKIEEQEECGLLTKRKNGGIYGIRK